MSTIDTSLHPEPSGAAAAFAAAHAGEHPLKLYGGWFCPFVQRAWMTLHEKGVAHQYVEINPYHKAPEFLALNPRGLVPTLAVPAPLGAHGGGVKPLYESVVVCEYLDEAFPAEEQHGPRLLPDDVYERARCRLWIDHISSRIVPRFYKFIQHTPDKPYSIEEVREEFLGQIKAWVREMQSSGPWFLGQRFSLVDVAFAPWACRLFLIDHYKPGGLGIPKAGQGVEDEEVWARWWTWHDAIMARPSLQDTLSTKEAYIDAYKRYAEDKTMSEVAKATRIGQSLP